MRRIWYITFLLLHHHEPYAYFFFSPPGAIDSNKGIMAEGEGEGEGEGEEEEEDGGREGRVLQKQTWEEAAAGPEITHSLLSSSNFYERSSCCYSTWLKVKCFSSPRILFHFLLSLRLSPKAATGSCKKKKNRIDFGQTYPTSTLPRTDKTKSPKNIPHAIFLKVIKLNPMCYH